MNSTRVAVFIDNTNIYKLINELKKSNKNWVCLYNPLRLVEILAGDRNLVGVYFYCTPPPSTLLMSEVGKKKYAIQNNYYAAIQKLPGIEMKFGNLSGSGANLKEKNLDTQLTADIITLAAQNKFDTAVIVSNDGDYVSAIKPTKYIFYKKIEVLYFKGHVSTSLWQLADLPRRARPIFFQKLPF